MTAAARYARAPTLLVLIASAATLVPGSARAEPDEPTRYRAGVVFGSTGGAQLVYRYKVVGSLHVELGGMAFPHIANGSVGWLVEWKLSPRWRAYVGNGLGGAVGSGPTPVEGCDNEVEDCELELASSTAGWAYSRVGVSVRVGKDHRSEVGFDIGTWVGSWSSYRGGDRTDRFSFVIPMAGVSFLRLY